MRALHLNQQRQVREAAEARFRARIVAAACIDPDRLSVQGQRTLAWLTGWDDSTVDGLVEILSATRTAAKVAQVAQHRDAIDRKVEALRVSEAAPEAALARYDELEAGR